MLERLTAQIGDHPKLAQWQPPLCGDIDIEIDANGVWHCQGTPFARERLTKLFASVLRCEADGDYYLVTPVEKWRIRVIDLPFVIHDLVNHPDGITLTGSLDVRCEVNADHPWALIGDLPAVRLWHGNWARIGRGLYYRLAEQAQQRDGFFGVELNGQWCVLAKV